MRYELKTPYTNDTTHIIFEPLDFIARLSALIPKPRVNLTRFHGVFAPNSKYRVTITPAKRGKGAKPKQDSLDGGEGKSTMEQRSAMTRDKRLKRVFNIDVTECEKCKGPVKTIDCIEAPAVIKKILKHLDDREREGHTQADLPPSGRAPPPDQLFMFEQGMPNRTDQHL